MEPITPLLPSATLLLHSLGVDETARRIVVQLSSVQPNPACPCCGQPCNRVHSYYARTIADLPLADFAVGLLVSVRKLRCDNALCPRKIFCERLPSVVRPWGRQTDRLRQRQQHIAMALGGQAGTRLSQHLGVPTSRNTLLRCIRSAPPEPQQPPRILGVDDWAMSKGKDYGTILVDIEAGRIIELLENREAQTLADWLRAHPGVEMICRDRASSYSDGASSGAPSALQIADRFHLVHNLIDVLQQVFERHRTLLTLRSTGAHSQASVTQEAPVDEVELPTAEAEQHTIDARTERRRIRQDQYAQARALHTQGWTKCAIARHLGIERKTVRRYVEAETLPAINRGMSKLDPYKAYLVERWNAGCRTGKQLLEEIRAQGYRGGHSIAYAYITQLRKAQGLPPRSRMAGPADAIPDGEVARVTPRQAAFLVLRRIDKRREQDQQMLTHLQEAHVEFAEALLLGQEYLSIVRERRADDFDVWLARAGQSALPAFRRFAKSLRRDYAAVKAALTQPWSSGPVEGHVNRLKLLKRQMYGRAKLDLLQRRLLYSA